MSFLTAEWKKLAIANYVIDPQVLTPYVSAGHETEFITEHYWGYARCNELKTNEYEVKHPRWGHYPVSNYDIDVDFGLNYGARFAFLNQEQPISVMLAEGSEVFVVRQKVIVPYI